MKLIYKVSGFRSLRDTEFRLEPGLNVFVGPNGSGKTNIAALIDFTSSFVQDGAHLALAKAGGSSRVFSSEALSDTTTKPVVNIHIEGDFSYSEPEGIFAEKMKRENVPARFEYNLSLSLNPATFDVEIDLEALRVVVAHSKDAEGFNLEVTASGVNKSLNKASIELPEGDHFLEIFSDKFQKMLKRDESRQKPTSTQDRLFSNAIEHASLFKLTTSARTYSAMQIMAALSFRRTINIDPQKVREPEDIASDRVLKADGAGAIGRLYAVISSAKIGSADAPPAASKTFRRVVSDIRGVNSQIQTISIEPNMETGKFNCSFTVKGAKGTGLKLPLAAVSDGTAKWLAIITAIRTEGQSVSIEEPENYLHPSAQKKLVSTLRDISKARTSTMFILTTHSETIINAIKPEELRVCSYSNLTTRVRTLTHPERIKSAINRTGFGLGFLYAQDRV